MKPEIKQAERKPMCPVPMLGLRDTPHVEWRITVNNRHGNSVRCDYVPAGAHRVVKEAHWIIWIDTVSIDHVPVLVADAKRQLKIKQAVGVGKEAHNAD